MLTLTEETIVIPAGSVACSCLNCDRTIYFVDREHGVRMPVDVQGEAYEHPRVDRVGLGRPHLKYCIGRK